MDPITFDDFLKVDMRAGTILTAVAVPKSKKLLLMSVTFGEEVGIRTIVGGIASCFESPEKAVGTKVVAVLNLEPRAIMGILSHGMLLAAHNSLDNKIHLMNPGNVLDGAKVG